MLTFLIILAIVAIILCLISMVHGIINGDFGNAIFFFFLILLNVFVLITNLDKYNAMKNGEVETTVVENVKGFSADTITVINGADTTRTYTITYWKDYE